LGVDGKLQYTLRPGELSKSLPTGEYKIKLVGADGLVVDVSEFTVKKDDKVHVRVQMETPLIAKANWIPLFNGKDLSGWTQHAKFPATWRVKNDVLIGRGEPAYLISERGDFENFHLKMEAKVVSGPVQRGLIFRAEGALGENGKPIGY